MSVKAKKRRVVRAKPLAPPPIDKAEVFDLAAQLLRELVDVACDESAVNAVLLEWVDDLGERKFSFVCMAAVQQTFATCLTPTQPNQLPPGGVIFARLPAGATEGNP